MHHPWWHWLHCVSAAWNIAHSLSHPFLHNKTNQTINLPLMDMIICLRRFAKANWVHCGEYLAPCFVLKCLEVSQETMSMMKFIHCTAFANFMSILSSSAQLNIEILWTWTDTQKCGIYSMIHSVTCVRKCIVIVPAPCVCARANAYSVQIYWNKKCTWLLLIA